MSRSQLYLRQTAILVIRLEDVAENGTQRLRRGIAGIKGDFSTAGHAGEAERPHIVESENVIGVAVGIKHGVNFANAFADGLLAEVGRGVDENGVPIPLHHDRRSRAPIVRICRHAHAAVAADGGHAHRGSTAQNREHCFH